MLKTSIQYKNELANDNRKFINRATVTLRDNTVIQVDSSRIMQGGVSYSDSTSSVGNFDLGAAIVNTCELRLLNIYDDYSEYDFIGARVIPYVGLMVNGSVEWLKKGEYTVEKANYKSSLITIICEDNMRKFDRNFADANIKLPVSAFNLLQRICDFCGVTLKTTSLKMGSYTVQDFMKESISCRDVLIYISQIEGAFARMNQDGYLELKWYNTSVFEDSPILDGGNLVDYGQTDVIDSGGFKSYNQAGTIDGGTFQALNDYHHIYSYTNPQIAVDPVIITGIQIDVTEDNETTAYLLGKKEYVIAIQNNPLITKSTVQSVAEHLKKKIVDMKFRPLSVNALGDPSREAGDPAYVTDRKGNTYQCYITNISYTIGNTQNISCDAKSAARNSAKIYGEITKNIVRDKEQTREEIRKTADGKNAIYTGNKKPTQPRKNDIWYKEIDDRLEMWIYDGTKWVLEASDLTGNEIKITVDKAKAEAQTAVANANAAIEAAETNGKAIIILQSDKADKGQIAVLTDAINLRVVKDEIITQINVSPEKILIAGDKIQITGKTTIEDAVITDAKIGNVSADKIKFGTLNGKVVNVININAANISTGTMLADFIRGGTLLLGGFNDENGLIEVVDGDRNLVANVDTNGFTTYTNTKKARLESGSLNFTYENNHIGDVTAGMIHSKRGIQIANTKGYIALGERPSEGDKFYYDYVLQTSDIGLWNIYYKHLFYGRAYMQYLNCGFFATNGSKSRVVETAHYGEQLQYCYEMATPYFGDIGEGQTDDSGVCYIDIDDIFLETVSMDCTYHVFLQKEGKGDLWVDEKTSAFFVIKGTPKLEFSWELKVRQKDYEYVRMGVLGSEDDYRETDYSEIGEQILKDYYKEMEELQYAKY